MSRLAPARLAADLQAALAAGLLGPDRPAAVFHDLGHLAARAAALQAAFPPGTRHALAIKANPVVPLLRRAVALGLGLEAASLEEVALARAAGCPPGRVVFDGPAKTPADLAAALAAGVGLNADSPEELAHIAASPARAGSASAIGLRLRVDVGAGAIAATSVGDATSRFGAALSGPALVAAFAAYPWLTGLHVHVGSQGCTLAQLVAGAAAAERARREIDAALGAGRVRTIDVGGGLPVAYGDGPPPPGFAELAAALRAEVPGLLDGGVALTTEFGRALLANGGWAAMRVEYVKETGAGPVAVAHLGADMFMRTAYRPADWPHQFLACDAAGRLKEAPDGRAWAIAGPLCFAGDVLGRGLALPAVAPGDWLIVRDAGAYTLAMWSHHCSRGRPPVYGREPGEAPRFVPLLAGDDLAAVVAFWGG